MTLVMCLLNITEVMMKKCRSPTVQVVLVRTCKIPNGYNSDALNLFISPRISGEFLGINRP